MSVEDTYEAKNYDIPFQNRTQFQNIFIITK